MLYTTIMLLVLFLTIAVIGYFSYVITRHIKKVNYISATQYGELVQLLQDKHELHRFGFGQYLKRSYNDFNLFHMSFMHMGMMVTLIFMANYLFNAVSISLSLFIFIVVSLLYIVTSVANARLLSAQPTAGGLYHVLFREVGSIWASFIGIIKIFSQLATTILYSYIVMSMVIVLISPFLTEVNLKVVLLIGMILIIVSQALMANMKSIFTRGIQGLGIFLLWLLVIIVSGCIVFIVLPSGYSPFYFLVGEAPSFIEQQLNPDQQSSPILTVALVILIVAKCFSGHDESAANAEETIEPKIKVPWATYLSTSYSVVFGFVFLLLIGIIYFNITGATYQPFTTELWLVALQTLHPLIQITLISFIIVIGWYNGFFSIINGSRHLMAMARDTLLPFSNKLANITLLRQTPHNAIIAFATLSSIFSMSLLFYTSDALLITHLIAVIVAGYSFVYFLSIFLTFYINDTNILWTFVKGMKVVQIIAIVFNIFIFTIATYFLSWIWLVLMSIAIINLLYIYLKHGYIKMKIQKAINKQEFELERNFPLQ